MHILYIYMHIYIYGCACVCDYYFLLFFGMVLASPALQQRSQEMWRHPMKIEDSDQPKGQKVIGIYFRMIIQWLASGSLDYKLYEVQHGTTLKTFGTLWAVFVRWNACFSYHHCQFLSSSMPQPPSVPLLFLARRLHKKGSSVNGHFSPRRGAQYVMGRNALWQNRISGPCQDIANYLF